MSSDAVSEIRSFNRFYTRQIGVLNEHVSRSRFSLQEARLLYEIAQRGHTTGAELSRVLGVDAAYVSRLLQRLLGEELVILSPSVGDRRSNQIALSRDGDSAFAALEEASQAAVTELIRPLQPSQRAALVAAMRTIRAILGDAMESSPLVLRPHRIGELGWLVHRQAIAYSEQYGWNSEFEGLIARLYGDFESAPDSPPKALWIAERQGVAVGSVFVTPSAGNEGSAQLRMLYVEAEARGLGIGRLLVDQVVHFARQNKYRTLRLWTQSILVPARKIYAAAGFKLIQSAAHHSFGHDLVGETWELEL
ncbi:MAG TPA: GNAT family N-acetyltransferase [Devosiaceae bacterium]|jgi:DNA-binding MarR family transcriptional regulator/GNAT superfamily N-acetyltransferase|nr:GNAT family N-acetyltransferase [Devosiaceae bacterium]